MISVCDFNIAFIVGCKFCRQESIIAKSRNKFRCIFEHRLSVSPKLSNRIVIEKRLNLQPCKQTLNRQKVVVVTFIKVHVVRFFPFRLFIAIKCPEQNLTSCNIRDLSRLCSSNIQSGCIFESLNKVCNSRIIWCNAKHPNRFNSCKYRN